MILKKPVVISIIVAVGISIILAGVILNPLTKNIHLKENKLLIVPKEASIGNEVTVELVYFPRLLRKDELSTITFRDSSESFDIDTQKKLYKLENQLITYPYTLGFFPYYAKFKYKIPSDVCPQKIVITTCKNVAVKKGQGSFSLTYSPQVRLLFDNEGYQGDGERISVPITIK